MKIYKFVGIDKNLKKHKKTVAKSRVLAYNKRGASAYFEDDTYFYYMSTYYTTE